MLVWCILITLLYIFIGCTGISASSYSPWQCLALRSGVKRNLGRKWRPIRWLCHHQKNVEQNHHRIVELPMWFGFACSTSCIILYFIMLYAYRHPRRSNYGCKGRSWVSIHDEKLQGGNQFQVRWLRMLFIQPIQWIFYSKSHLLVNLLFYRSLLTILGLIKNICHWKGFT